MDSLTERISCAFLFLCIHDTMTSLPAHASPTHRSKFDTLKLDQLLMFLNVGGWSWSATDSGHKKFIQPTDIRYRSDLWSLSYDRYHLSKWTADNFPSMGRKNTWSLFRLTSSIWYPVFHQSLVYVLQGRNICSTFNIDSSWWKVFLNRRSMTDHIYPKTRHDADRWVRVFLGSVTWPIMRKRRLRDTWRVSVCMRVNSKLESHASAKHMAAIYFCQDRELHTIWRC